MNLRKFLQLNDFNDMITLLDIDDYIITRSQVQTILKMNEDYLDSSILYWHLLPQDKEIEIQLDYILYK